MADAKLEIQVVVDGVDVDKLKSRIKELKAEIQRNLKSDGMDGFKKNLQEASAEAEKSKAKIKDLKARKRWSRQR